MNIRRRALHTTLGVALFALVTLAPTRALAGDDAMVRFERGVQLYEAENYEAALAEFSTAYKLSKNYKLLYNIAICQMATHDYVAASESFRSYLADGGAEVGEPRRKDVQERLGKLGLMLARVRVTSNAPAGTVLSVDDRPVGKLPLTEPLTVKTGRRQFTINVAGRTTTKAVDITSGDTATVELALEPALAEGPATTKGSAPADAASAGPSFPWPLWAVTGVLAGGAVVTGVLAVDARNDLGAERARFNPSQSDLDADHSRARTLGIVTDALIAGSLVSAGISTWLTIRYLGAKKSPATAARAAASARPTGGLVLTPAFVSFSRSF